MFEMIKHSSLSLNLENFLPQNCNIFRALSTFKYNPKKVEQIINLLLPVISYQRITVYGLVTRYGPRTNQLPAQGVNTRKN